MRKIDESKDSEDEEDEAVLAALQGSEAQVHVIMVNYFDCFLNGIYDCTELFACVYVCIILYYILICILLDKHENTLTRKHAHSVYTHTCMNTYIHTHHYTSFHHT